MEILREEMQEEHAKATDGYELSPYRENFVFYILYTQYYIAIDSACSWMSTCQISSDWLLYCVSPSGVLPGVRLPWFERPSARLSGSLKNQGSR